jgi:hypothetical protein
MRSTRFPFRLALVALVAATAGVDASPRHVGRGEPRAVVELFTSPSCSACPATDRLFVKLAHSPDLITLVMPVDIWNRPNRRDELAVRAFTERQIAYAEVRHEDMIYTPQAMINGAVPADGSDAGDIGSAVAQTAGILSVPVSADVSGQDIVVAVAGAKGNGASAVVTVLPYVSSRTVRAYGEKIVYANLVRDIVHAGTWDGAPLRRVVHLRDFAQYDGVVVLLQAGTAEHPGAIIGAKRIELAPATSRT